MNINAVNEVLPQPVVDNIHFELDDVRANLPFLVNLSFGQRKKAFKMSHKRYNFVSVAIDAAKIEPQAVPSWIDVAAMQNDFELSNQLFVIENKLESLLLDIKDTRMQIGAEALKSASDIYVHVNKAKDRIAGLEGIYDNLKKAFPGRGKGKVKNE